MRSSAIAVLRSGGPISTRRNAYATRPVGESLCPAPTVASSSSSSVVSAPAVRMWTKRPAPERCGSAKSSPGSTGSARSQISRAGMHPSQRRPTSAQRDKRALIELRQLCARRDSRVGSAAPSSAEPGAARAASGSPSCSGERSPRPSTGGFGVSAISSGTTASSRASQTAVVVRHAGIADGA